MRGEAAARAGLALLVVALIAGGLATVGGPGTGRVERRDGTRLSDIQRLATYVRCLADTRGGAPTDALRPVETCRADIRFDDPFTGEPYRYERISPTAYRLCAAFENADWLAARPYTELDADSGCIQFTHAPG